MDFEYKARDHAVRLNLSSHIVFSHQKSVIGPKLVFVACEINPYTRQHCGNALGQLISRAERY